MWELAGLGHCPLWDTGAQVHARLQVSSLKACLQECERQPLCRYAGFVNTDVVRRWPENNMLCHLWEECPTLLATLPGAVTYHLPRGRSSSSGDAVAGAQPWTGSGTDFGFVTIGLAPAFAEAPHWQRQLCRSTGGELTLEVACSPARGSWRLIREAEAEWQVKEDEEAGGNLAVRLLSGDSSAELCADAGAVHVSEHCERRYWALERTMWQDPRLSYKSFEAGVFLRSIGGDDFLTALGSEATLQPLNRSAEKFSRWSLGFKQPWRRDVIVGADSWSTASGSGAAADVWLMASQGVNDLMQNLLASMRAAQDSVRVHIRWIADLRSKEAEGWDWKPSAARFINAKMLLMAEAMLFEAVNEQASTMSVIMDTDVQVWAGWASYLASCVQGVAADVCFFAQPQHQFEVANCGVIVLRNAGAAANAFLHSALAWFQSMEAHGLAFPAGEQHVLNSIIRRAAHERTPHSLRYGIYNAGFARVGLEILDSHHHLRAHHATGKASLKDKIFSLKRVQYEVSVARSVCGTGGLQCRSKTFEHADQVAGPVIEECLVVYEVDPHFGPFPDCWRVNTWWDQYERVREHLRYAMQRKQLMDDHDYSLRLAHWMREVLSEEQELYVYEHVLKASGRKVAV